MQGNTFDRRAPVMAFGRTILSVIYVAAIGTSVLATPAWSETHVDGGGHTDGDDSGHDGGRGSTGGHTDGDDSGHDGGTGSAGGINSGGHTDSDDNHNDGASGGSSGQGAQSGGQNGGNAGSGATGNGRPVWAQEGIPEVELGRLNVVRSPTRVLDRALDEALSGFTAKEAAFYRLDLDAMITELSKNWDGVSFIDSPLQNLALFRDAADGSSVLRDVGIVTDNNTLLAVFLGTASDKTIPITADTVTAVSAMLNQPLTPAQAAALAEDAELIRRAVLAGHG